MAQVFYQTLMSGLASLCFGVLFQVRGKNLVCAGIAGGVAWFVYMLAGHVTQTALAAYFLATVATTIYAEVLARILRTPAIVFLAVGIIPLVPGGGIYRTMLLSIRGTPDEALAAGIHTIQIAGAIAMGVVIVSSIVRVFWHQNRQTPKS
ncbi:MAG: threonine/serine exporter family protein [Butyricicoccus pullicaecorum]|nr:threonine/serine exporter family protein [Butyricicoccus pullicaecorum]